MIASDEADRDLVAELLGRTPQGPYEVVVRSVRREPRWCCATGRSWTTARPCPPATGWWIPPCGLAVGRLEADGGVRRAEAEVDAAAIAEAHARYAAERDAALPPGHVGPRPSAGVGGTRQGVKCLHAHYAWFLAGGDDPVGRWVDERLAGYRA